MTITFDILVDTVRQLTLSEKEDLKQALEKSIVEERRKEFQSSYLESKKEYESGSLTFTKDINQLRKMVK